MYPALAPHAGSCPQTIAELLSPIDSIVSSPDSSHAWIPTATPSGLPHACPMGHLLSLLSAPSLLTQSPLLMVFHHQPPLVSPGGGPIVHPAAYICRSLHSLLSPGLVPPYMGVLPSRCLPLTPQDTVLGLLNLTGLHNINLSWVKSKTRSERP